MILKQETIWNKKIDYSLMIEFNGMSTYLEVKKSHSMYIYISCADPFDP